MTEDELKELERLEAEATPGPWQTWAQQPDVQVQRADGKCIASVEAWGGGRGVFDADFITAARNALPALVTALRVERRRAEVAEAMVADLEAKAKPKPLACCDGQERAACFFCGRKRKRPQGVNCDYCDVPGCTSDHK